MKEASIKVTSNNINEIRRYFSSYDSAMKIYDGNFTANWLLSDIHDDIWITRTPKTIKDKSGNYKYTYNIRWDRRLPNDTALTDRVNHNFLHALQRMYFILYESPIISNRNFGISLRNGSSHLFILVSWLFLNNDHFSPSTNGFSKLTQLKLDEYVYQMSTGGSFKTLKTGERIIEKYNSYSSNKILTNNIFELSKKDISNFIGYLKDMNLYTTSAYGVTAINKSALASHFNISKSEMYPHSATLFLRQFEPEIDSINKNVLIPSRLLTEYPSHKTPLKSEIKTKSYSGRTIKSHINLIESFMKLKSLYPELLPNGEALHFNQSRQVANKYSGNEDITRWIPLKTCLELLNKSIDFILNYGDSLLTYYDLLSDELIKKDLYDTHQKSKKHIDRNFLIRSLVPDSLSHLNISSLSRRSNRDESKKRNVAEALRQAPSAHELIEVLQGACLIVVAGLKPVRINELSSLKYDCLSFKENDGYWLKHDIQKAGINSILPNTMKPIPSIAAKAIRLLQRYNMISRKVVTTHNEAESSYLLYGLNLGNNYRNASIKSTDQIHRSISLFSDYINLELDEFGRRWYVNIHELRKSFLLTFFWTFKFSSLDSCRWIAGHRDDDHVISYIQANIPGEELVEVEAEYAQQQLRLFSSNKTLPEMQNIETLNNEVCNHFNVNSISEIPDEDLKDWLAHAIERGTYSIEVYGIEDANNHVTSNIAFRIKESN